MASHAVMRQPQGHSCQGRRNKLPFDNGPAIHIRSQHHEAATTETNSAQVSKTTAETGIKSDPLSERPFQGFQGLVSLKDTPRIVPKNVL
jgi:hypothetical protein